MKRLSVLAALALALCVGVPSVAAAPQQPGRSVVHLSAAPGVSVVSYSRLELGDSVFIDGEYQNTYPVPVEGVEIAVTAYDASGKVVAQQRLPGAPQTLDPGDKAPFMAGLTHTGSRYDVRVVGYRASFWAANHNFAVTKSDPTLDAEGRLHIQGTVTNNNLDAASVSLDITYYDAQGVVVGSGGELVDNLEPIAPGASSSFEFIDAFPPDYAQVAIVPFGIGAPTTATELEWLLPTAIGSTVNLTGTAQPGEAVSFEQYIGGSWQPISSLTATADATTGAFTATYKVAGPAYVRAKAPSATSPGIGIVVSATTTFKASAASVKKGAKVTLSGTVKPGTAGTVVTIQRKVGSKWTKLATVKLSASGAFTYAWVPKTAGTYVLRASVPAVGLIQAGASASKTVKVK